MTEGGGLFPSQAKEGRKEGRKKRERLSKDQFNGFY